MEWIILICALGIAAYLYYYKRPLFDKHRGFIELSLIIFTALFTIYQVRSSTADFSEIVDRMDSIITKAEESSKSLHNVDSSLSNLPTQIDSFSSSINSLNNVVSSQRELLSQTLEYFNQSIWNFKGSVDSMAERFNRKPDIRIDLNTWKDDTSRAIPLIVLVNEGKLLAEINIVRVYLPTELIMKVGNTNFRKETEQDKYSVYELDLYPPEPVIADMTKPKKIDFNAILKNENFEIRILVYYRASFGNDGSDENLFRFYKNRTLPSKRR
ncbi:MAG: hypothetical protein IH619_02740 [Ignavibacterium sp.]|nr:hypothetical protein [Ignavibacterium sp.]